jgi:hypothetical protein
VSNTFISGKRIKRGLYQALFGQKYNANVNGSLNTLGKVVPNAFSNHGIGGVVVHPIKVTLNYSIFLAHKVPGK